ncbi:unnamed protein product [Closterium sp. NIES-53]
MMPSKICSDYFDAKATSTRMCSQQQRERERHWQRELKLRRLPHKDQGSGISAGGNRSSSYADSLTRAEPGERERRWRQREFKLRRLPHKNQGSGSGVGGNGSSSYADSLTRTRGAGAALAATGLQATQIPSHVQDEREREQTALAAATREFKLRGVVSGEAGARSRSEDQGAKAGI